MALLPALDFFDMLPSAIDYEPLREVASGGWFYFGPLWLPDLFAIIPTALLLGAAFKYIRPATPAFWPLGALAGLAITASALTGWFYYETETITVQVVSANGQPVPSQQVSFLKRYPRHAHEPTAGTRLTDTHGIVSLRMRKGFWVGCSAVLPSGTKTILKVYRPDRDGREDRYARPTSATIEWRPQPRGHDEFAGPRYNIAVDANPTVPFQLILREQSDSVPTPVRKTAGDDFRRLTQQTASQSEIMRFRSFLGSSPGAVEFLDQIPAIFSKNPNATEQLIYGFGELCTTLARLALDAEKYLHQPSTSAEVDRLRLQLQKHAALLNLPSNPDPEATARQVRDKAYASMEKIHTATASYWSETDPQIFKNSVVIIATPEKRDQYGRIYPTEPLTRVFPPSAWIDDYVAALRKCHRKSYYNELRRGEVTMEEARPYFDDPDPWVVATIIYAVEDRIPQREIPSAQAKLRAALRPNTDEFLVRMTYIVIGTLEERRTGQRR
jgi:hypothetical protein